jgi:hypothetical protein
VVKGIGGYEKPIFKDGDIVDVAIEGNVENIVRGTVIGIVSEGIIDWWIVQIDETDRHRLDYDFRAFACQHYWLRKLG